MRSSRQERHISPVLLALAWYINVHNEQQALQFPLLLPKCLIAGSNGMENQPNENGYVNVYAPGYRPICPTPWCSRALDWIR